MSEQMQKLVEEISLFVTRNVLHEWTGADRDCPMYFGRLDFEPKDVEWLIARIGKAYADGEMSLPGEEWRGDLCLAQDGSEKTIITYLAVDGKALGEPIGGPYRLIALSPSGREEEPSFIAEIH